MRKHYAGIHQADVILNGNAEPSGTFELAFPKTTWQIKLGNASCERIDIMITPRLKISAIEIPAANLKRAVAWYQEVLAFNCVWSDKFHALLEYGTSTADTSEERIKILLVETSDSTRLLFNNSNTNMLHSVVDFQTDDIDAFHIYLQSKNTVMDIFGPPANDWAPRGFAFFDSEGNRLGTYTYRT